MITYEIQSKLLEEGTWHTVWIAPADRTTIEELVVTLGRYRRCHPDVTYRLVKHEVIG